MSLKIAGRWRSENSSRASARGLVDFKEFQRFAVDSGEIDQFDEVYPAFSGLGLGNEGLGA
jgi:hypothetical protein